MCIRDRHFADTIHAIRHACPQTTIEVLTPDFLRKEGALEIVVAARPDVFNHNLETVPSLYLNVRPGARYFHSIRLLPVSYTHLRAHETVLDLVCRLLL